MFNMFGRTGAPTLEGPPHIQKNFFIIFYRYCYLLSLIVKMSKNTQNKLFKTTHFNIHTYTTFAYVWAPIGVSIIRQIHLKSACHNLLLLLTL